MTDIEQALENLRMQTESLPFAASVAHLYGGFRELAKSRFLIRNAIWLNAFEIAAIAKWVYLTGHGRSPNRVDWPSILNAYKILWRATEAAALYPEEPAVVVSFALRFVYQQLVWNITPEKMQANFLRTRGIFGGNSHQSVELRRKFENAAGVDFYEFLKAAHVAFALFMRTGSLPDYEIVDALRSGLSPATVSATLNVLSTTRNGFRKYYELRAQAKTPSAVVYEFNPLLRYPIILREDRYSCVFPELINYASTRGLYLDRKSVV